jgi:hypothetical protein
MAAGTFCTGPIARSESLIGNAKWLAVLAAPGKSGQAVKTARTDMFAQSAEFS